MTPTPHLIAAALLVGNLVVAVACGLTDNAFGAAVAGFGAGAMLSMLVWRTLYLRVLEGSE